MSIEQNKAIARREVEEIESQGNLALADELFASDFRLHFPGFPALDREGFKQVMSAFRTGFPNLTVTVEEQVAEGDKVVNRLRISGTQTGEFQGIPPTGRPVQFTAVSMMRLENGKLAEIWGQPDIMGLMQQLGVIPATSDS